MQAITFSSNLSQRTVKLRRRSARRPISERREIDSWGPYLPGGRADQTPNVASRNALPIQDANATGRGDQRLAENLPSLQSSEVDRLLLAFPHYQLGSRTQLLQTKGLICVHKRREWRRSRTER